MFIFSNSFAFVFSVVNFVFLTTFLLTTSLNFFKTTGTVFNVPKSTSSIYVLKLFKLVETLTNLLMPSFSTSAFKATKYILAAILDVSTPVACSNSFLVA